MGVFTVNNLHQLRRLGVVTLAALCFGTASVAIVAMPLGNVALAKGSGHGGKDSGGKGKSGGKDSGQSGKDAGKAAKDADKAAKDAAKESAKAAKEAAKDAEEADKQAEEAAKKETKQAEEAAKKAEKAVEKAAKKAEEEAKKAAKQAEEEQKKALGKLNAFFHASPEALAHASPNSAIGRISRTFKEALSAYAGNTTGTPPTTSELGAILAKATNKAVTPEQVKAIATKLAEVNPDDAALGAFAASGDEQAYKDIADAANAARPAKPEKVES
jgi:colicin import membrane protein